ncbi:hypothetical protein L7F22_025962 [Adiantum nelumboides]|nr:hypothetical protein [Adiantum nelumboides]
MELIVSNSEKISSPKPWLNGYLPHKSHVTSNAATTSAYSQETLFENYSETLKALPEDLNALLQQAKGQRHGVEVFSQQPRGTSFSTHHLFNGVLPTVGDFAAQEPPAKAADDASFYTQLTIILPAIQVRKAQSDLESRALIGMIAGPRSPVEVLRGWIRNHWGTIGAEVEMVQALSKNQYVIVFKTPEMAFKVLSSGKWLIRTSPLCLFKWNKDYNPERDALNRFPVWVEFPNLPLHYHNHLRVIGSAMGKVLGGISREEYVPSWHPQVLIEMDVSRELPQSIIIALDDGESFEQPVIYKYLPNACFHCEIKGHFVRDCPIKNPAVANPR